MKPPPLSTELDATNSSDERRLAPGYLLDPAMQHIQFINSTRAQIQRGKAVSTNPTPDEVSY